MVAEAASVLSGVTLAPTKVSATILLVMAVNNIEALVSEFNWSNKGDWLDSFYPQKSDGNTSNYSSGAPSKARVQSGVQ